ncbi:MAG: FHA domain-containing protein, partial [Chloroflexota bacterium]
MSESELSPFKLVVTNADGEAETYDLPIGQLVVGRRDDCDIVLDHPRTQRQHAKLTIDEKGVTVGGVSRRSRIEVNGNPLPIGGEARVVLGDSITLGIYRLELVETAAIPAAAPIADTGEVTDEATEPVRASADAWQFVIQSLDSNARYVVFPDPFPAEGLTIGRQDGSDVLLDHPRVELKEALLVLEDGAYTWQALTRRSGTLHNGNPVSPDYPMRLEIGDIIECGPFQIFVEWVGLDRPKHPVDQVFSDVPVSSDGEDASGDSSAPVTPTASGASGGSSGPPGAFLPDYLRSAPPPPPDFSKVMPPGLDKHSIR